MTINGTHHSQRVSLYKHSFRERTITRLMNTDALPREGLQYVPVVEAVVVRVRVHVGQRQAVELGVGQTAGYGGLEMLLLLERKDWVRLNYDLKICQDSS